MADTTVMDWVWKAIPYVCGLAAIGLRNEIKTNRIEQAVFDKAGDMRLRKVSDCGVCMQKCKDDVDRKFDVQTAAMDKARNESREDIKDLHKKIDDLPQKIIDLLK